MRLKRQDRQSVYTEQVISNNSSGTGSIYSWAQETFSNDIEIGLYDHLPYGSTSRFYYLLEDDANANTRTGSKGFEIGYTDEYYFQTSGTDWSRITTRETLHTSEPNNAAFSLPATGTRVSAIYWPDAEIWAEHHEEYVNSFTGAVDLAPEFAGHVFIDADDDKFLFTFNSMTTDTPKEIIVYIYRGTSQSWNTITWPSSIHWNNPKGSPPNMPANNQDIMVISLHSTKDDYWIGSLIGYFN